jgi:phenylalanyl-tRNA synthetase alpha chain
LKRKVELGNSGIFRPEMLRPMGFPEDVSVIAWGLGLERPTMIQFDISNIKELLGPAVSLKKVKDSAIFCL